MKKWLIWGLVLGTLAVVVADLMHRNDGYALIVLSSWRIEMSLKLHRREHHESYEHG